MSDADQTQSAPEPNEQQTQPPVENGVVMSDDAGTVMAVDLDEEIEKVEGEQG
ncbi:MAG TPA: hypothetical protein VM345_14455 [Acidimicrobiales bacterium]|nr:hypothetical protein [Acidimicrobiales bacterium]